MVWLASAGACELSRNWGVGFDMLDLRSSADVLVLQFGITTQSCRPSPPILPKTDLKANAIFSSAYALPAPLMPGYVHKHHTTSHGHVSPTPRLNEADEMGEYWLSVLEKILDVLGAFRWDAVVDKYGGCTQREPIETGTRRVKRKQR